MRLFDKPRRPAHAIVAAMAVFGLNGAANSVDLGDASVMSMQGQRLKIAVPYGSKVGEKVPVLRFSIESVEGNGTRENIQTNNFVISQPEFRNVIYLQSRDPVTASNVKLVLNVADNPVQQVAYDLAIPPLKFAQAQLVEVGTDKKPRAKLGKRKSAVMNRPAGAAVPKTNRSSKAAVKN